MKRAQWALAGLVGMLALVVAVTADAQVVTGGKPPPTLKAAVVKSSKQKDEVVDTVFKALGPAFRAQLQAGRAVEIPGVGVFRVVRVSEYKDLEGGRPVIVPARSYVEYVPAADVTAAANAPGTVPAKNVQGYEFRVNPNAASGLKTENGRNPGIRTR
jgi:nucleoid DNA-binding protein